jgi:EAL domain-containing protein (putative c-di-GMP-specific phosphodiesterase class I)
MNDDGFLRFLHAVIEGQRQQPETFCFEITETAAIVNLSRAAHFIRELKALGCRFALDDFGSGLSSFSYLKHLPVDYLKIDGTFVRGLASDPVDGAMVEAINKIGHVMGLRTIAEYVEQDAVLEKLRRIGVDYVQGNAIAPPQPFLEAEP